MKKLFKFINLLSGFLFLGGVIWYVLYINSLSVDLYTSLSHNNILLPSYLILACGLFSFILSQAVGGNSGGKEIVYVDKITQGKSKAEKGHESSSANFSGESTILTEILSIQNTVMNKSMKTEKALFFLCDKLKAGQGIIYKTIESADKTYLEPEATYAYSKDREQPLRFELGEGLAGLAAKENKFMMLDNIPQGYVQVFSGLGSSSPSHLLILPLTNDEKVNGVLELGLFEKPNINNNVFFKELSASLGNLLLSA